MWYLYNNISLEQVTTNHERGRNNIDGNKADFTMSIKILSVTASVKTTSHDAQQQKHPFLKPYQANECL
jgi:hypothetical protein